MVRQKTVESQFCWGIPGWWKAHIQDPARGQDNLCQIHGAALYDPEDGYYTTPGEKIGPGGLFHQSDSIRFGKLLAKQIIKRTACSTTREFILLEMGAGKGLSLPRYPDGFKGILPIFIIVYAISSLSEA
jgi:hypothetical protein